MVISEKDHKIQNHEQRIKELQEQYEIMNRERASTVSRLEKKIGDMETKEKRLQEEIDTLKQERD